MCSRRSVCGADGWRGAITFTNAHASSFFFLVAVVVVAVCVNKVHTAGFMLYKMVLSQPEIYIQFAIKITHTPKTKWFSYFKKRGEIKGVCGGGGGKLLFYFYYILIASSSSLNTLYTLYYFSSIFLFSSFLLSFQERWKHSKYHLSRTT